VPADPSSPIPPALAQLTHADSFQDGDHPDLLAYLATVPDPRAARGRRHPLIAILAMAAAAVLAGARSVTAIAEWAAEAPQPVRAALGARRDAPGHFAVPAEATIRRTLARLDPEALVGAIGAWLTDRNRAGQPPRRPRAVAVDGKTLRGARRNGRQVHLLACMDHTSRAVLAQRQVDGAPGEVPGLPPLLAELDLADVVVTADALQTHPQAAEFLVTDKQAHYLLVVKANQPTLLDRCRRLPWQRVPVLDRTRDRGHGRIERRTLKVVSVNHFGFPHTAQVIQVTRKTRDCTPGGGGPSRSMRSPASPTPWPARPASLTCSGALGHRGAAPPPRCHLRRGHLQGPHRRRPQRHGDLAQPGHRGAVPRRAGQPRRRLASSRPRPRPPLGHPRHHLWKQPPMNRHEKRRDLGLTQVA
jgi:predicted transposase YbfD/YdcC